MKPMTLTQSAFNGFGSVIETSNAVPFEKINDGTCQKFARLADVDCARHKGFPSIHLYRAKPFSLPMQIEKFERHPLGTQTFVPLSRNPYLVVVAPPGEFQIENIRTFLAQSGQGVHLFKGTWHHFCIALESISEFLVIDRTGPGDNCDEITLPVDQKFEISL